MSKKNKLLNHLLSNPSDFTYEELVTLLGYFGYTQVTKGKTSGSRVKFVSNKNGVIYLHKPHQRNELLEYQIKLIIDAVKKERLIWITY